MQASFRGFRGMQVHAVPESDRAIDASGRKLPWAYDADPTAASSLEKREPTEKGPFGRSVRRSKSGLSRSRSRTVEPRREEDKAKAEQLAAEDAVFGSLRKASKEDGTSRSREALGEIDANAVSQAATTSRDTSEQEATEVMLLGFGDDSQWAAIDFYERVSGGSILEDYDRQAPGQRYDASRSISRASRQKSLSRAALRKKNRFAGGNHWIKVTFNSRSAAELACARSPHIIKGGLVYAEPWQGRGPGKDEFIPASQAGAQITDSMLPLTFSTNTGMPLQGSPNGSSTTATSATATANHEHQPQPNGSTPSTLSAPFTPHRNSQPSQAVAPAAAPQTPATIRRRGRIEGATPAQLLPASSALLPKQPKPSWSTWLGTSEVIGSAVPKKDDGSFDYDRASLYWRLFFILDDWLGTDFCGIKGD